ncbi:MAG: T9SS type A sorting domain-containing protein [Bacteroidota bacterium]
MTVRVFLLAALALVLATPASTQECAPARAEAYLEGADVRALLFNNGALFWKGGDHVYEVPKGSGRQSIFSAAFWLSGTVDGEPRFSGSDYGPYEYWPGPLLEDGGAPSPDSCAEHDRIWSVTLADVAAYNATGETTDDLREWPAHLGAPVVDGDGDPTNYDLAAGDRPNVYGGHVLWWIMNDLGGTHEWGDLPGLGVEVRVSASAASEGLAGQFEPGTPIADLVRTATHYRFEILHRGTETVEDVHVGLYVDADLGFFSDDYVGTDSTSRMVYAYNGDDFDEGSAGYGDRPPAVGIVADRPPEGVTTRGSYMSKNGGGTIIGAFRANEAANALRGFVRDGSYRWTFGEDGTNPNRPITNWTFPALPPDYWSMARIDSLGTRFPPSDKRMMIAQGPYTLAPGDGFTFEIAIPWARADGGGALGSVRELVTFLGPAASALPMAPPADLATILPTDSRVGTGTEPTPPRGDPRAFALAPIPWPNPVRDRLVLRYDAPSTAPVRLAIYDALGREVSVALDGPATLGYNRLEVDASRFAPGLYTYRLVADGEPLRTVGRFVVVR